MQTNRILKVLVRVKPETRSVAVIVKRVFVPVRLGSEELIVAEVFPKVNQSGFGDIVKLMLVAIPAGFVIIVGY